MKTEPKLSSLGAELSWTFPRRMMTLNNERNPKRFIVTSETTMILKAEKVFVA